MQKKTIKIYFLINNRKTKKMSRLELYIEIFKDKWVD